MKKVTTILFIFLLLLTIAAYGPSISQPTLQETPTEKEQQEKTEDCDDYETQKQRIQCRINLPKDKTFNYIPEECRGQKGIDGETCVNNYKRLQKCFSTENYDYQMTCAKTTLGITLNVDDALKACTTATNEKNCKQEVAQKTYTLIKFRIYSYEYYIQELYKNNNINEYQTTNFISRLETLKQQFNQAPTIAIKQTVLKEFKTIIDDVKGLL